MDAYSLGEYLREAREAKEFDIEDVVAALRIRQPILESFEAGEFEIRGVPEIQIRGLLRIYGRHLELDEDHVLLLYDQMRLAQEKGRRGRRGRGRRPEPLEEPFSSTQPLQEIELAERRSSGCRSALRLLLLLLLSAAAVAVIAFVTLELVGIEPGAEPQTATDAPADTPSATAESPVTAPPAATAALAANRSQYSGSGILVSLLLTQRSWLSLEVDGAEAFVGIAEAQTLLEYSAESEVLLSASNARALDLIWNGQRQGQIGARGQRVDIRFTVDTAVVSLGPASDLASETPTEAIVVETVVEVVEQVSESSAEPSPSPIIEATPAPTLTPIATSPPVAQATVTPLPTQVIAATATEPQEPTAILPPRVTQAGLPPTKEG
ncbi:MAG: helix-turn-helix domain-containing protein [Chloroflexi bacterium]|nr:helix-turn-helix domain-containing protein [Chloroflexota bacterium]